MTELYEVALSVKAEADKIAEVVQHPKRKYRYTPEMSALIVNAATGGQCDANDILASACPRMQVDGMSLFADEDLFLLAEEVLDAAPVIIPNRKPRAPHRASKTTQSVAA
jgi:hypothetical protein